jgi:hypothetical protein
MEYGKQWKGMEQGEEIQKKSEKIIPWKSGACTEEEYAQQQAWAKEIISSIKRREIEASRLPRKREIITHKHCIGI